MPYHPQRWQVNWETGNIAGPASAILEIPVSWYLDDFPALAYTGNREGMSDTDGVLRRWKDILPMLITIRKTVYMRWLFIRR